MKCSLSPRDFQRAQAIFHSISQLESQYRHPQLPILVNIFWYWLAELATLKNLRPAEDLSVAPFTFTRKYILSGRVYIALAYFQYSIVN